MHDLLKNQMKTSQPALRQFFFNIDEKDNGKLFLMYYRISDTNIFVIKSSEEWIKTSWNLTALSLVSEKNVTKSAYIRERYVYSDN